MTTVYAEDDEEDEDEDEYTGSVSSKDNKSREISGVQKDKVKREERKRGGGGREGIRLWYIKRSIICDYSSSSRCYRIYRMEDMEY